MKLLHITILTAIVIIIILVGASCQRKYSYPSYTTPPNATSTQSEQPVATDEAKANTGIIVADQKINEGIVTIKKISTAEDAWIDIHLFKNGKTDAVVGHAPIYKGSASNILVSLDSRELTPELVAMAHVDKGRYGIFEYPGPDEPMTSAGQIIQEKFRVLNSHQYSIKTKVVDGLRF